jgi:hypothetical protein
MSICLKSKSCGTCNQIFCEDCISAWSMKSKKCPTCKGEMKMGELHPMWRELIGQVEVICQDCGGSYLFEQEGLHREGCGNELRLVRILYRDVFTGRTKPCADHVQAYLVDEWLAPGQPFRTVAFNNSTYLYCRDPQLQQVNTHTSTRSKLTLEPVKVRLSSSHRWVLQDSRGQTVKKFGPATNAYLDTQKDKPSILTVIDGIEAIFNDKLWFGLKLACLPEQK